MNEGGLYIARGRRSHHEAPVGSAFPSLVHTRNDAQAKLARENVNEELLRPPRIELVTTVHVLWRRVLA
jgi:hypothetical protein